MGILFVLIIGVGIYLLFSQNLNSKIKYSNSKSPKDILKERLANGEIDVETYNKMNEALDH